MIAEALQVLTGNKGTKQEIFSKISEMFNLNLDNPECANYKTLNQALSKSFIKNAPQEFILNTAEPEVQNALVITKNASMKNLIIAAMLQMPNHRGQIKEIKAKMYQIFFD